MTTIHWKYTDLLNIAQIGKFFVQCVGIAGMLGTLGPRNPDSSMSKHHEESQRKHQFTKKLCYLTWRADPSTIENLPKHSAPTMPDLL